MQHLQEFIGRVITDRIVLWRERSIIKILLLPGAAWFSFGGFLNIFLTLSLNPVFLVFCFFSLIIFDSVQPWKYIFVYTYAVNADFFSLWKAICSRLSWSFSLWKPRCFSFHSLSQNPAKPLAHHLFSCGGIGRRRLWWCQALTWHRSLSPTYTQLCALIAPANHSCPLVSSGTGGDNED